MPLTIIVGVVTGLMIAWTAPAMVSWATDAYDAAFPVMRMSGTLVEAGSDYADVAITGRKLRGEECRLHSVYAYSLRSDGSRADASATRVDRPASSRLRDHGVYDIGVWRIYPVIANAARVQVWTHHVCVGRDVLSMIADVPLQQRSEQ